MLGPLKFATFGALAVLCLGSVVLAQAVATPDFSQGDAAKGKRVYQRVGACVNCHGWPGDGQTGLNPMVHSAGANLRETQMDDDALFYTIRCGVPGTQMPYHDQAAYKDGRCNGLSESDFGPGEQAVRGKTFSEGQTIDLIAYLRKYVIGHGKPNYEDCVLYFDASADKACSYLKDK